MRDRPAVSRAARVVARAALTVAVTAACAASFDRDAAVDRVLERSGGRLTRSQAECYVDRVVEEAGSDSLTQDQPSPEKAARLTRIRTDCIGVAGLGTSVPPASRQDVTGGGTAPMAVGTDPALDALHAACGAGSGEACDELFTRAPPGSEYEDFALSCGGRTAELRCADRYAGGEVR